MDKWKCSSGTEWVTKYWLRSNGKGTITEEEFSQLKQNIIKSNSDGTDGSSSTTTVANK
jgi:hypothetical protein